MRFKLFKNKEKINTVKLNTNDNERTREKSTGRSMVEMLGVLAIIGVLSIGGISGYTIAMRKYRANEILNVATKYATIIWTGINSEIINDPEKYLWFDDYLADKFTGIEPPADYLEKTTVGYELVTKNFSSPMFTSFNNAGLGGLPSGVKNMKIHVITASKSGILVNILVELDDQSLCETLKSQLDLDPSGYVDAYTFCENYEGSYYISIGVPQK